MNKFTIKPVNPNDPEFNQMADLLNRELAQRDGEETAFYSQFNGSHLLSGAVIAHEGQIPVGIAGFKKKDSNTAELKRMYVPEKYRGSGLASEILSFIEKHVQSIGYSRMVLETGLRQPEAIAFYLKSGYTPIGNFEPYIGVENSRCFGKRLD